MELRKFNDNLLVCFTPKELANLLTNDFYIKFIRGLSNPKLKNTTLHDYLLNNSSESRDYEYYVAIFDLYELFNKDCEICYRLNNKFTLRKSVINTIDDLIRFREEFPDVIVRFKKKYFEFELKRYKGKINLESLYDFVLKKIIKRYSGKTNYLILLQGEPGSKLSYVMFKKLHEKLKKEGKFPGYLGLSFNAGNKDMVLVRIFPELNQFKRPLRSGSEQIADLFRKEQ